MQFFHINNALEIFKIERLVWVNWYKSIYFIIIFSLLSFGQIANGSFGSECLSALNNQLIDQGGLGLIVARLKKIAEWEAQNPLQTNLQPTSPKHDRRYSTYAKTAVCFLFQPEVSAIIASNLYALPYRATKLPALALALAPSVIAAATLLKGRESNRDAQENNQDRLQVSSNTEAKTTARRLVMFFSDYLISSAILKGMYYSATGVAESDTIETRTLPTLSSYNSEYASMARQLNLDPGNIFVDTSDDENLSGSPAGTWHGFKTYCLSLDPTELMKYSDFDKKAIIGHELMHLHQKASLKLLIAYGLALALICGGLKGTDWLVQKAREKCNRERHPQLARFLDITRKITYNAFNMPFISPAIKAICLFTFLKYYERSFEKEADIESAQRFGTARELIHLFTTWSQKKNQIEQSLIEKMKDGTGSNRVAGILTWSYYHLVKFWMRLWDEHPSLEERIRYLTPIAAAQEK